MLSAAARRAVALHGQKRLPEACRAFGEALAREAPSGTLHRLYGLALRDAGHAEAAVDQLKAAIVLDRDEASMRALAETLHCAGRLDEARRCLEALLARAPDSPQALRDLAALLIDQGEHHTAAALLRRALEAAPDDAACLTLFGKAGLALGFVEAARTALLKARDTVPAEHAALCRLADALCEAELEGDGLALYDAALVLQPGFVPALGNRAAALLALGRPREALAALHHADRIGPATPQVLNLLVAAWRTLGEQEQAERACARALRAHPGSRNARAHDATLKLDRGRFAEALDAVQALTAERPDDAELVRFEALLLLLLGRFEPGWEKLEGRLLMGLARHRPETAARPRWAGENPRGRRILVAAEEGFGDTIQFVRYAALLAARGATVGVCAPEALHRLLAQAQGVHAVHGEGDVPEGYDAEVPMLSLPRLCGTVLDTIPADIPYLAVDPDRARHWRSRLAGAAGLRAGLVWAGNPKHRNDHNRSIPWAAMRAVAAVPGAAFHSLQVGPAQAALAEDPCGVADLAPELADYHETACAILALDLVITVDTSVAHLAGALGVPVWVLLPLAPDWRWLLGRDDSPWYPTARLFRQERAGDWSGVLARVSAALATEISAGPRRPSS